MEDSEKEKILERKWYTHPPLRNALIAGLLTGIAFGLGIMQIIPSFLVGPSKITTSIFELTIYPFKITSSFFEIIIYILAIVLGGYYWSKEGLEELIEEKEIGIEILMLVATLGAAVLGVWEEAALLVFLYGAAEGVEEFTFARTRASIRKLLDLAPKEARVLRNGDEITIPAESLKPGDIFLVRPGESMPTDGIIIKGRSSVNEAPVTGESLPVEKKEGMGVFAATINQEGVLEIEASAAFEDNTLSKMIHLVEEAQEQKGKAQLFIEKFGRRYSPVVLLAAVAMTVIPPFFGVPWSYWAARAVVFLVAAAPCALVMSTPVAIAAGIGRAGRSGVLIKGGMHLENLGKIKVVAFDKTGTLTKGEPVVTDIIPLKGDEQGIMCLAYGLERYSEHPLARAIVEKAEAVGARCPEVTDFSAIAGYGVTGRVGGRVVYVGKPGLFKRFGFESHSLPHLEELRAEGKTVMLIGAEESIEGIIAFKDEIRPQAKEVIEMLHHIGVKTVMLTGDHEATARAVATELGIDEIKADLKPEDKIKAIEDLEREYAAVAMVGDGINDAPALARATVGIAMGTAGTDAAIEAADIALMADDLGKLAYAVMLGKKARRISKENIIFSLLVLGFLIPTALAGIMSVALAVLCHEASELLAVANGLRAARA